MDGFGGAVLLPAPVVVEGVALGTVPVGDAGIVGDEAGIVGEDCVTGAGAPAAWPCADTIARPSAPATVAVRSNVDFMRRPPDYFGGVPGETGGHMPLVASGQSGGVTAFAGEVWRGCAAAGFVLPVPGWAIAGLVGPGAGCAAAGAVAPAEPAGAACADAKESAAAAVAAKRIADFMRGSSSIAPPTIE
jgi:hypothetical protein